jgi:hypothetical protein
MSATNYLIIASTRPLTPQQIPAANVQPLNINAPFPISVVHWPANISLNQPSHFQQLNIDPLSNPPLESTSSHKRTRVGNTNIPYINNINTTDDTDDTEEVVYVLKSNKYNCEHNRQRSRCKECKGSGICQHNRRRSACKECKGSGICQHNRQRSACKKCKK